MGNKAQIQKLVIHRQSKWGTADKENLYDRGVSLSAKAIYQILLNVTDSSDGDIAVNSTTLARYTQEPAEAIESCLDELEAAGYLDGIGGA